MNIHNSTLMLLNLRSWIDSEGHNIENMPIEDVISALTTAINIMGSFCVYEDGEIKNKTEQMIENEAKIINFKET